MGGDVIAGTNFVDALKVFETDDDTQAIILVGELGGTSEEEAADWIKDYNRRVSNPKPIAACIGGFQAKPGKVTGHAGAWTGLGEGTSEVKYKALEAAGVTMVDHPAKFGGVMKDILAKSGRNVKQIVSHRIVKLMRPVLLTMNRSSQQLKRVEDTIHRHVGQPSTQCGRHLYSKSAHCICRRARTPTS